MKDPSYFWGKIMTKQWKYIDDSTSPEPLGQFQSHMAQIILGLREYKFFFIEGPRIFPIEDNYKIAKIKKKRISSIKQLGQFQPNFAKTISYKRGFKFVQMERSHLFTLCDKNIVNITSTKLLYHPLLNYWFNFILHIIITLLKCIHWF